MNISPVLHFSIVADPTTGTAPIAIVTTTDATFEEITMTLTTTGMESSGQCTVTAITTGVVSVIITALLVAGISLAIQIAVYQCVYKPRLRSFTEISRDHSQREEVIGGGDATVYDVVDERVGTALEMNENEAYSIGGRMGGLELKQNEAYGVARST